MKRTRTEAVENYWNYAEDNVKRERQQWNYVMIWLD